jgi:flagellar hook-length control protein FliK
MPTSSTNPTAPQGAPDWTQQASKPWPREPADASPFDLFLQIIQPPPCQVVCPPATTRPVSPPVANEEAPVQPTTEEAPAAVAERADDQPDQEEAASAEAPEPAAEATNSPPSDDSQEPTVEEGEIDEKVSADVVVLAFAGAAAAAVSTPLLERAAPVEQEAVAPAAPTEPEIQPAGEAHVPVATLVEVAAAPAAVGPLDGVGKIDSVVPLVPGESSESQLVVAAATAAPAAPETATADAEVSVKSSAPIELPAIAVAEPDQPQQEATPDDESDPSTSLDRAVDLRDDSPRAGTTHSAPTVEAPKAPTPIDSQNQLTAAAREPAPPPATTAPVTITPTEAPYARLPVDLLVRRPAETRSAPSAQAESIRLLGRVARAFAVAAERGGEVTLRLSPPELGSLRVEVQVRDSALVARIEAETMDAQTTILENLAALRERLADQGVRIERFDVDLMNRQGGGAPQRSFDERHEAPRPPQTPLATTRKDDPPIQNPMTPPASAAAGRLNVVI